jgi:hypothetical protein
LDCFRVDDLDGDFVVGVFSDEEVFVT